MRKKKVPPAPPKVELPPPPEPPRKVEKEEGGAAARGAPAERAAQRATQGAAQAGVRRDHVVDRPEGDSSVAVPVGKHDHDRPAKSGKGPVVPLPMAPPPPPKPSYAPVSELYVKSFPEIDGEACARTTEYPDEAKAARIEGDVQAARGARRARQGPRGQGAVGSGTWARPGGGAGADPSLASFKPAHRHRRKPVAFVIQSYKFTFQLER